MPKPLEYVDFEISMPRILAYIIGLAVVVGGVFAYVWVSHTTDRLDRAREFQVQILNNARYEMCYYRDFDSVREPEYWEDYPEGPRGIYRDALELWTTQVPYSRNELLVELTSLARAKFLARTEAEFETVSGELREFCGDNWKDFNGAIYDALYS